MYESPLDKIYGEIQSQIVKQDEENVMYVVNQAVDYAVDKEELIKALQYDRNQYQKGYADAKAEMQEKFNKAIEEMKREIYCGNGFSQGVKRAVDILEKHIEEK